MAESILYVRVALEEMQELYRRQVASFDAIKATARAVLSSASLIVALVSTLQLLTARIRPEWIWLYQVGIGATVVLYVVLIALCSAALWPVKPFGPLAADWDVLVVAYKGLSEKEVLLKRLSSVLNAMELNSPLVQRYSRRQAAALVLLPVLVVTLLLLALVPRG